MKRLTRLLITIALVVTALPLLTAAGNGNGHDQAAEHRRVVDFWTHARVAQAVPRDFVLDAGTGSYIPRPGKPPGTPGNGGGNGGGGDDDGGGSLVVTGDSWNGGAIEGSEGKVLFALGSSYYVCSATVIDDGDANGNGSALIITAAHCVYDEVNNEFAQFWTFIPDYDAAPAPLSSSSTAYCDDTAHGCWTQQAMAVHQEYATAGGFNDQAVVHDFAVVRVGLGGKSGQLLELDDVVDEQGYDFGGPETFSDGADVATWGHAFGYPAAKKYKGNDLVYCFAPFDGDPYNDNDTYRLNECEMTGGSSGGGWFYGFAKETGSGTLFSVNSYGYNGVKAMHGPFFNSDTQDVYDLAKILSAGSNGTAP